MPLASKERSAVVSKGESVRANLEARARLERNSQTAQSSAESIGSGERDGEEDEEDEDAAARKLVMACSARCGRLSSITK